MGRSAGRGLFCCALQEMTCNGSRTRTPPRELPHQIWAGLRLLPTFIWRFPPACYACACRTSTALLAHAALALLVCAGTASSLLSPTRAPDPLPPTLYPLLSTLYSLPPGPERQWAPRGRAQVCNDSDRCCWERSENKVDDGGGGLGGGWRGAGRERKRGREGEE